MSGYRLPNILDEAKNIVDGDRAKEYGDVDASFTRIAALWSAYLSDETIPFLVEINKFDVAKMMILLKVSRAAESNHRDSYIDIAGYVACVDKMLPEANEPAIERTHCKLCNIVLLDEQEGFSKEYIYCRHCLKRYARGEVTLKEMSHV
jgi:hypothetical protein